MRYREDYQKKPLGQQFGQLRDNPVQRDTGPAGLAVIVEALTDNRNRTAGEFAAITSTSAAVTSWHHRARMLHVQQKRR